MANARTGNVLKVDTTADFTGVFDICEIKYIGDTGGTATIKKENTSGGTLWEAESDTDLNEQVSIRSNKGIRVEVANNAVVYLYLK